MSEHTPGPWLVERQRPGDEWTVWTRQPHTGVLAFVQSEDINGEYPAEQNARLIAAAPELLGALDWLLGCADQVQPPGRADSNEHERWQLARAAARAAIAKATRAAGALKEAGR